MRLTSSLFVLISCVFASKDGLADEKKVMLEKLLDKAKSTHIEAKKDADEKLLKSIDSEMESVRKSSLKADQRLKVIGNLEKEKERFEKSGWLPVTERLQKATMDHLKSVNQADKTLDGAYEKLLSYLLAGKDTDTAKKLNDERKARLPRRLVICLEIEDGTFWSLYADELTEHPKQRWRFAKGEIIFEMLPESGKGKPTFDIAMMIGEDGQNFHCFRGRKYTAKRVDAPKK